MRSWIWSGLCLVALASPAQRTHAESCDAPSASVRLMLHEPDVLSARLAHMTQAPDSPAGRLAALRQLFAAAGCPQIVEPAEGKRRNLECFVRGQSDDVIVVGVNQQFDSLGSVALLPSLIEAMAAAPRRHTFRYVAFSAHEAISDRVNRVQKPKGAMRLLDALSDAERERLQLMVHVGPVGYGPIRSHPDRADDRLACAFEHAAKAAGLELGASNRASDCVGSGAGPQSTSRAFMDCRPTTDWTGGQEWDPFLRRGISVFGIHSEPGAKFAGRVDPALYVRSYRMLAIFLALADDALGAAPPVPGGAAASE